MPRLCAGDLVRLRAADVASFVTTIVFAVCLRVAGVGFHEWQFWFLLTAWVALGFVDFWALLTRERNRNVAARLAAARARRARLFDQETQ